MVCISLNSADGLGKNFIPQQYLPNGKDEYYQRNTQIPWPLHQWRPLSAEEREKLVQNGNTADDWNTVLVTDPFEPNAIKRSSFYGLVRIGRLPQAILEHHDLRMPVGISNSVVIASDIGHEVALHNVRYIAHYIIGDRSILFNIDEMLTTDHAKFGNGIIKEGESENVRIWLDLMNEVGSRKILPFDGMIPADAYLWAKYRDDGALQKKFLTMTQNSFDAQRGYYSTIGEQCVIKNSRSLKDVKIGSHCYIKGANKLKNLTIHSSEAASTQIGEGVELVNGIVGYGCHIFYGCKAVRFILGDNSNLKYGARLIHSFLGDNSTVSCCEILNNLIFPAHEQHHNNSFLIASLVMGQSNVAAGATIGSNHNSRANDNEVQAGRGFWPGLCTSIKHSSRFASFVLLSKADYPAELDIPFPFSLVNNNPAKDRIEILPAFWWLHNMYALARNTWKFQNRDTRNKKVQNIEFDSLAPDTMEEIIHARRLLELWTAKAYFLEQHHTLEGVEDQQLLLLGKELLTADKKLFASLEILGEHIEKTHRKAIILKGYEAYHAYTDMLYYYAVKNITEYLISHPQETFLMLGTRFQRERQTQWVNIGGQLVPETDIAQLRNEIGSGTIERWDTLHERYQMLWQKYPLQKQQHAFAVLCFLLETHQPSSDHWNESLTRAVQIQEYICHQVYATRQKDYENSFMHNTYRNAEEMAAAIGSVEHNSFIQQVQQETKEFRDRIETIRRR